VHVGEWEAVIVPRLRVGLVGAGLVGQAEHAFCLWEERERFDFVALADASATVRAALASATDCSTRMSTSADYWIASSMPW